MMNMASSTQFASSRRMGIYDAVQQMSMWEDTLRAHMTPDTGVSIFTKADPSLSSKVKPYYFLMKLPNLDYYYMADFYWNSVV